MSFENTLRSATVAFCLMAPTLALADPAADARAAAERWDQAYNKGDMDGLKGLYVSDAMVIPKGAAVSGADSIQTFFSGLKSKGFDDHTVKVQAAQMRGDLLVATGRWQMSGPGGEGGAKKTFEGNWVNVFQKEGTGWRSVLHTWN
ncbi:YybH family protein [uncultured Methylobacterium sp.]|uniref:YybH family protein n=1 Tax=uncultured Methylobacterium sp. TaxID=157278 RepID=UPI0035CB7C51